MPDPAGTEKERLAQLNQKYLKIIRAMHDALLIVRAKDFIIDEVNPRLEKITGYDAKELRGKELFTLHPPEFRKIVHKALRAISKEEEGLLPEIYLLTKNGEKIPVEVTFSKFVIGEELYILMLMRDIQERLSIQKKLYRLNRLYRVLISVNEQIVRSRTKNELYEAICRIIVEEGGFKFAWIGEIEDEERITPAAYHDVAFYYRNVEQNLLNFAKEDIASLVDDLKQKGHISLSEKRETGFLHQKLTVPIWHDKENVGIPLYHGKEIRAILKIYSDEFDAFTEEEIRLFKEIADDISYAITMLENKEKLEYISSFDLATQLPNRHFLKERIDLAIYSSHYTKEAFALILIDIDQFKLINNTFGYGFGDKVIQHVAKHLKLLVRPKDILARYDSDEFAILYFDVKNEHELLELIQRINDICADPLFIDGEELYVTLSLGISLFPKDAKSSDDLRTAAETALKNAKEQGGNTFLFYSKELNTTTQASIQNQNELTKAIHNGEFTLFYQPQIDLRTMRICGAEALIRWDHPQKGMMPPGSFLPHLEESSLIEKVGKWVINEVCRQILVWRNEKIDVDIPVAINISPKQIIRNEKFFHDLLKRVKRSGIDPKYLHVEITESLIMENLELAEAGISLLNRFGIKSAIDDFGTGYSSLYYLKKLPVHMLKIDRVFIKNIPESEEDCAIVNAIVSMGKSLGKATVAEGIETKQQLEFVKKSGCDIVQGFYFAKPMPAKEFERFYHHFNTGATPEANGFSADTPE
ncbi:sensor domain-containing protein [Hydrogenimonas cancrithermarum]|uniref:Uncharacterized protein n=1 Tax=Hydrogenimonas cancrithermarum TaxID=2993563 RepID=A0ABN6WVQ8_9BACT|nr:EAL domain-containing protein [Hydrogenimonas cancrithermarum]BDY13106.1 hypothetical protein HCR_14180 [Hydrogenimonas cancrithermarum]